MPQQNVEITRRATMLLPLAIGVAAGAVCGVALYRWWLHAAEGMRAVEPIDMPEMSDTAWTVLGAVSGAIVGGIIGLIIGLLF
jgi:hypothetical protein